MNEEIIQTNKDERGALTGIAIILIVFLIGGFFFWENDVSKLAQNRSQFNAGYLE